MPGRVTVYGAQQLLSTYFAKTSEPPPSFYLALIKEVAPSPYMSGSELDEPDNPDYARIEMVNDGFTWANDSAPQEIYNSVPVQFMTAATDWGVIRYWALCNASVDGYNLLVGDLENPVQILIGDQAMFDINDLSLSLGPFFLIEDE